MTSLRFGTGISKPLGVVCFGSSEAGCCTLSPIRGEVSACHTRYTASVSN